MSQDKFLETFDLASELVAKNYSEGTIPFLAARLPGLLKQIDSAEDKINENWGTDFNNFKKIVQGWKDLYLKAIFKFRQTEIVSGKKKFVSSEKSFRELRQPANIFDIIQEG